MTKERAASNARCAGSVGLYVYRQCARLTRSRVNGKPYCWQHERQDSAEWCDGPAPTYECPRCYRAAPWTDGRSADAGDPFDEFWCQTCGEETPLADMRQITTDASSE